MTKLTTFFASLFVLMAPASLYSQSQPSLGPRYFENLQTGWQTYSETIEVLSSVNVRQLTKMPQSEAQLNLNNYWVEPTRVVILARGSEIIAERNTLPDNAIIGGNSMSKSVTSLVVGQALCKGHIHDINDFAQTYAPELEGTSWGRSTVRQLLMMSSGAYTTQVSLNGHPNEAMLREMARPIMGNASEPLVDIMRRHDLGTFQAGTRFNYSNADTIALGLVLKGATGQETANLFSEIWGEVGASRAASWLTNVHGETMTYMGFAASPHDWVRLGLFIAERMEDDDCFGNYLKEATNTQIDYTAFADNRDYGYQFWTKCGVGNEAFCMVGALGQLVLINAEKDLVLYVHSVDPNWGGINHWGYFFYESLSQS